MGQGFTKQGLGTGKMPQGSGPKEEAKEAKISARQTARKANKKEINKSVKK